MPAFNLPLPAAYVVITATTGTLWITLTYLIRLFVRLKIHGPFSWDNIHCSIATVLAALNSILTISEARYGLGRHIEDVSAEDARKQQLLSWIAALLFILALCFSMLSVCCLIVRITQRTSQAWIAQAVAVVTGVWAGVAFFLIAFICELPRPWVTRPVTRCIDIYHAWMGIAIVNALLDLANICAAVALLWGLKMPWRPKALVLALFTMRLLVIPPTLTRLKYIKLALESKNWTYSKIDTVIITQIILHLSVILTTVPCIKPYLNAFESGALQAPAIDTRELPSEARTEPTANPLLPISQPRPALDRYKTKSATSAGSSTARHRNSLRQESWPRRTWSDTGAATITTVEYDAEDAKAKEQERRKSKDSASSRRITRTLSLSIEFEEAKVEGQTDGPMPSNAPTLQFEDAGVMLTRRATGVDNERKSSMGTARTLI